MWTRSISLTLLIGAALVSGRAPAAPPVPETAIEASTANVSIPRNAGGSLLAKGCISCRAVLLRLDASTRLFIGRQQVSLAQLNAFLADGITRSLTIMYDRNTSNIIRIVVNADLSQHHTGAKR